MSDDEVLRRLAALEVENRSLRGEVDALRRAAEPPAPRPPQQPLGQGPRPPIDTGAHYTGPSSADMTSTGGGSHSFRPWRTLPNGQKVWAPDNIPRNRETGEVLHAQAPPMPAEALPTRTSAHQQAIDILDRALPIGPPTTL